METPDLGNHDGGMSSEHAGNPMTRRRLNVENAAAVRKVRTLPAAEEALKRAAAGGSEWLLQRHDTREPWAV